MLGGTGTGVSTYARTLLAAIAHAGHQPALIRADRPTGPIVRFGRAVLPGGGRLRADGDDRIGADIFRVAQRRFSLTGRLLDLHAPGPPGIVHWTYPLPLRIVGWRNLYTVHDVIPLTHPQLSPVNPRRHARLLAAIWREADRIVTVSAAARQAIGDTLGWSGARLVDCGEAVLPEPDPLPPLPDGLESRRFLLFCGRIEHRKNLLRLLRAYAAAGVAMPLVLAGPETEESGGILAAAGATPGVRYLGYAARETIARLVADARALLLPSLAEGFGLPVAEAVTAGTPALVSDDAALRETAGDAGVIVPSDADDAMASAIRRLATDDVFWEGLAAVARRRSPLFGVDAFASRLDAVYRGLG